MAVRRIPAIPGWKLYISEKIMTRGACILKKIIYCTKRIAPIITCIIYIIYLHYMRIVV